MRCYLIYKLLFGVLVWIFFAFYKVDAAPLADNYLWLELDSGFSNQKIIKKQEINIYFGRFPDEKQDLAGLHNLSGFYTQGKKDNQGREIFYPLHIKKEGAVIHVILKADTFNWYKIIVTAREERGGKEYNYCAMTSAFISGDIAHFSLPADKPSSGQNFAEAFDVSLYREGIREEFGIYRKRSFPLRLKVKFNRAPFNNRPIKIIDIYGGFQQITTSGSGELVYFPKDKRADRSSSENKFNADLVLMENAIDNNIYISTYTIHFSDAVDKERNFSLQLGLAIFISSFTMPLLLFYRKGLRHENL
jgi:hypothetical protein